MLEWLTKSFGIRVELAVVRDPFDALLFDRAPLDPRPLDRGPLFGLGLEFIPQGLAIAGRPWFPDGAPKFPGPSGLANDRPDAGPPLLPPEFPKAPLFTSRLVGRGEIL